jgi:hypothetical protein
MVTLALTKTHQPTLPLWDGLTAHGNLTHTAIHHIENALAEVVAAQDCLHEMEGQMANLTRAQETALRRCWLLLGDLRYMREPCSSGRLQERADQWREEHVYYAGAER